MEQTAKFEGWALVELFGHQREAGYVTTQYFGDKAMFQIDVPEIPAQQVTLERPEWADRTADGLLPAGTVVERESIPGRTRIVNPGAVYALNPATEEAVRTAITRGQSRSVRVVSLPETKQIAATTLPGEEYMEPEEDEEGEYEDAQ